MPTYETTTTHINGLEAKTMLKSNVCNRIDKIKYLTQGNAFPRIKAEYALVITAYPADCPVPEAEFMFILNSPEVSKSEIQENINKIEIIEAKRARLLESLELCDKVLDLVRPVAQINETLDAGNIPDELRIKEGQPIPVIKTSDTGRRSEVYIQAEELRK